MNQDYKARTRTSTAVVPRDTARAEAELHVPGNKYPKILGTRTAQGVVRRCARAMLVSYPANRAAAAVFLYHTWLVPGTVRCTGITEDHIQIGRTMHIKVLHILLFLTTIHGFTMVPRKLLYRYR